MKWSLTHKLVAAWMRMAFYISYISWVTGIVTDTFCCFWKCNRKQNEDMNFWKLFAHNFEHIYLLICTHNWELMKSVQSNGNWSLPYTMKVMVWYFVNSQGQTGLNSSSVCFVLAKTDITVPSKCYCGIFLLSHRYRSVEVTSWKVPKMVDHGIHRLHNGLRVLGYRWYIKNDSNSLGTVSDCIDNVGMLGNLQDLVMAATSFILAVSDTPFVSCFKVCELWQCSSGRICHTRS
jgi:hypothetical protein